MNAISFFSGIGAFDLGLHSAGIEIIAQVENNEFCQNILRKRWQFFASQPPEIFGDIREIDTDDLPQEADLFIGGFPCQPFSNAGFKKGQGDDRNMWGDFYRIIGEYLPRWVVLENVPGITISNNERPAYALEILKDLTAIGYDACWAIISAQDCGLPHERKRWFCIAEYSELDDTSEYRLQGQSTIPEISKIKKRPKRADKIEFRNANHRIKRANGLQRKQRYKPKSRLGRNVDGITAWMDKPPTISGRNQKQYSYEPDRFTKGTPEFWSNRIKSIGNSGIPSIAYYIGKTILETST